MAADLHDGGDSCGVDGGATGRDEILDFPVDKAADDELPAGTRSGVLEQTSGLQVGAFLGLSPEFEWGEFLFLQQSGGKAVLEIMPVVGDLVGNVCYLGLEGRARIGGTVGVGKLPVVLAESLKNLEGKVESALLGIALFQQLNDAQALGIVVEAAMILHEEVEHFLPGMTERRMAEVVSQRDRLGQVLVETEGAGNGPADGGHLDGVGQAGPVMVSGTVEEDLGLSVETAKGGAVDDAIPVPLIAGAEEMFLLGSGTSRRLRGALGIGSEESLAWVLVRLGGLLRH
jgi:hypothetical protein